MTLEEARDILTAYHKRTGATHWASSMSVLPILLDIKARMKDGDKCFLSKAHAVTAYKLVFETLPDSPPKAGPFCSLGMAMGFALGVAKARPNNTIYVVTGDGELQEGANLEALFAMQRLNIRNVHVYVEKNGLQAMQATPPLELPIPQITWVTTYKGDHWRVHYENPK